MVKARPSKCCRGRIRLSIGKKVAHCLTRVEAATLGAMLLEEASRPNEIELFRAHIEAHLRMARQ